MTTMCLNAPLYYSKLLFIFLLTFSVEAGTAQKNIIDQQLKALKQVKDNDSAAAFANSIVAAAKQKNDPLVEPRVLLTESSRFYRMGNIDKALDYARQATALASTKDPATYTKSTTMVAYMLSQQGKNVAALKIAFDILRKTDACKWKKQSVDCRLCIADIYRTMNNPAEALPYAERAAKDALNLRDSAMYVFALSNLSNLYSTKSLATPVNMARATAYMSIILTEPYYHLNSDFDKARYLSNIGRLYRMQQQYDRAESALTRSLQIAAGKKFPALQRAALNELTTVMINRGKYTDAIKYAQQNLALLPMDKSSLLLQHNIYDRLTEAYAGLPDYKEAYIYAQKARQVNDSLLSIQKAAAATELDKKYKADERLLVADNNARLLKLQRNFIIVISFIIVLALLATYRFFVYKRKKEACLLAEQNRQLEQLDAMKSRFFANISHELRTPLTLILGPLDLLMGNEELGTRQQQNHLKTIWHNSKKMHSMVNELLDLGKIESGNLPVKLQPTALFNYFTTLYQGFVSAADYKHVSYELTCSIDQALVADADREKLEKIFNNLAGNAIKFTPAGGSVNVNVSLKNAFLELLVTDTGPGIHLNDQPHIFDRYYQGAHTDVFTEGGSGVGLAIAREFTELLGGRIYLESAPGKGSTFKVCIPIKLSDALPPDLQAIKLPDNKVSLIPPAHHKKLIMLVEDHPEMAAYITSILAPYYQVVITTNGLEALQLLQDISIIPQLIISDVMMPGMDGFTLLDRLKAHTIFCRIPVIMLTALADDGNRLKALQTGVDDYITKPFISGELLARASNLISNAAARAKMAQQDIAELRLIKQETSPEASEPNISPADLVWLADLENRVRQYAGKQELTLDMLSYDMAISERQLFRRIKSITGLTPNKYIRTIRLQIAREAIESGRYRTIAEISYAAGFDTPAYFSKLFKEHYGKDVHELI